MQGNGEHHANDERLPATARAAGFASPFDRPEWFDLLEAHGFAGRGRIDAHGSAGSTMAWLPLRTEKPGVRSEEHTSELQSLMRISYAVFCLKKKKYSK